MQTNDWREGRWLCKAPVSLTLIPSSPSPPVRFYSTQHETGPNNNLFLWAWWLWNKSWNLGATAHLLSFLMGTPALPPKSVSCSQFSRWRGYSQRWRSRPNKQWARVCVCVRFFDRIPLWRQTEAWWITTRPSRCSFLQAWVQSQVCRYIKLGWKKAKSAQIRFDHPLHPQLTALNFVSEGFICRQSDFEHCDGSYYCFNTTY